MMEPLILTSPDQTERGRIIFPISSGLVLVAGSCLHLTALATDYWGEDLFLGLPLNFGLFRVCYNSSCVSWSDFPGPKSLEAVRACEATAVLGAVLPVIALLGVVYNLCGVLRDGSHNPTVGNFAAYIAGSGATCIFVCILVWYTQIRDSSDTISYSFIISIIGGFVVLLGSCLDYKAKHR